MEKIILKDLGLELSLEEVLRTLHIEEDEDDDDFLRVREMHEQVMQIADPKAVVTVLPIEERGADYVVVNQQRFSSALVAKNLDKTNRVIAFVCTCGTEAEEWSKTFTDVLEQYWADGIKLLLLGKVMGYLHRYVREHYVAEGVKLNSMNPGSLKEWPLSQQRVLFAAIGNVEEDVGVTLSDSCLMLPSKSNSGFYFTGDADFVNCSICPILDCPGRRAEYTGAKQ